MTQKSATSTKEITDREVVVSALLQMIGTGAPIFYSNEPKICSHNKSYISGDLDILLGEIVGDTSAMQHMVTIGNEIIGLNNTQISETKCEGGHLAAKRLTKKREDMLDLATTTQPVLQLTVMGQLQSTETPLVCFYMNRYKVRPFIYFPSIDVMLASRRAYVWRTDDQLMLRGCLIIALLLRFNSLSNIPEKFWTDSTIPKTGFLNESEEANIDIAKSYFVKTSFKPLSVSAKLKSDSSEETIGLDQRPQNMREYLSMQVISCDL